MSDSFTLIFTLKGDDPNELLILGTRIESFIADQTDISASFTTGRPLLVHDPEICARGLYVRPDRPEPQPLMPSDARRTVQELGLSKGVSDALHRMGIFTWSDLVARSQSDLMGVGGFGQRKLAAVKTAMSAHGLRLVSDTEYTTVQKVWLCTTHETAPEEVS